MGDQVLTVKHLSVTRKETGEQILKDVSFSVPRGNITAIIGESGSGKSMTAKAILDLLPKGIHLSSGCVDFFDENVFAMGEKRKREYRGTQLGFVFQDIYGTFDPMKTIGQHFHELFSVHTKVSRKLAKERALQLLTQMQLPDPEHVYGAFPHELSGGMRQRVQLALALALDPVLLMADEPTTALDVRIQKDVLRLIKDWSIRTGGSVLFITHDLGVVAEIADSVVVMKDGTVVETASVHQLFDQPIHQQTKELLHHHRALTKVHNRLNETYADPLLTVHQAQKIYFKKKWFQKQAIQAVNDVSFCIGKREIVGLIGESGSGKSTLSRLLLQLEAFDRGGIKWNGALPFRRGIQWVHQDPLASFDPRWNVERIVGEGLDYWKDKKVNRQQQVKEILRKVGLAESALSFYPHELSGGMRQRVALARSLFLEPELLILDEPFASLDMSSQAELLTLLRRFNEKEGTAILFISHDIRAAIALCHRILVMEKGQLVEETMAADLSASVNIYTQRLLSSMLAIHPGRRFQTQKVQEEREYAYQKV
ncbi:ABC transporter ATP-binding protein [Neobacillus mesonae]|uniref:ABC transporter ATP-binding protein n=1 Tax=Neobacillus mesonae TaxID=1193713 RepID=UPI002E24FEA4|nr:ABC transporter ATP-binding protein [Neobacillus mesonae]